MYAHWRNFEFYLVDTWSARLAVDPTWEDGELLAEIRSWAHDQDAALDLLTAAIQRLAFRERLS